MTTVSFLGFEIGNDRIQSGTGKMRAIQNFAVPASIHQVRHFLGRTGYFKHFVHNYAMIAQPLTKLTKTKVTWEWGPTQEEAFQNLKKILINRPVLALLFNPNMPTKVHCDVNMLGLAGILMQLYSYGRFPRSPHIPLLTTVDRRKMPSRNIIFMSWKHWRW